MPYEYEFKRFTTDRELLLSKRGYRVVDGDTIEVLADLGFYGFNQWYCRLATGKDQVIDCPEENKFDVQAIADAVRVWLNQWEPEQLMIRSFELDNYQRRFHGDIVARNFYEIGLKDEYSLSAFLITAGMAKYGKNGKRHEWTSAEAFEANKAAFDYVRGAMRNGRANAEN